MKIWFENNWIPILVWCAILGVFGIYFLEAKEFLFKPVTQIKVWQLAALIYVLSAIMAANRR